MRYWQLCASSYYGIEHGFTFLFSQLFYSSFEFVYANTGLMLFKFINIGIQLFLIHCGCNISRQVQAKKVWHLLLAFAVHTWMIFRNVVCKNIKSDTLCCHVICQSIIYIEYLQVMYVCICVSIFVVIVITPNKQNSPQG